MSTVNSTDKKSWPSFRKLNKELYKKLLKLVKIFDFSFIFVTKEVFVYKPGSSFGELAL